MAMLGPAEAHESGVHKPISIIEMRKNLRKPIPFARQCIGIGLKEKDLREIFAV
jgi:hypothetical protein